MRPPDQPPRAPQTVCTCHRCVSATQPPWLGGLPSKASCSAMGPGISPAAARSSSKHEPVVHTPQRSTSASNALQNRGPGLQGACGPPKRRAIGAGRHEAACLSSCLILL